MPLKTLFPVVALLTIGVSGCNPGSAPSSDDAADRAAIASISKAHARAFFAGDIDTIVSAYAEDAVVMPPDAPAAKGREAIRKLFAASMAATKPGQSLIFEDYAVQVSGDMGWDSGVSKVEDATGAELIHDGRVDIQVAAIGIQRIVNLGEPRFLEDRIGHEQDRKGLPTDPASDYPSGPSCAPRDGPACRQSAPW